MVVLKTGLKGVIILLSMLFILTSITGCAKTKKMSNEDFNNITAEFTGAFNQAWLSGQLSFNMSDKETEKFMLNKLEEICKKYGYSKEDYERKGEEIGIKWQDQIKKSK